VLKQNNILPVPTSVYSFSARSRHSPLFFPFLFICFLFFSYSENQRAASSSLNQSSRKEFAIETLRIKR